MSTRQQILEKALELFTDKSYEGASMDDIAQAVGIRKASLYAHFSGKESLFTAVFEDILAEYARVVGALTACAEEDATARLRHIFLTYIAYCKDSRKMYFWDRYFYYPPAFLQAYIRQKTLETETQLLTRLQWWVERARQSGALGGRDTGCVTCAYYYLMIGLSMSVRLYERDALLREARTALDGLCLGGQPGATKP